jgi:hypothetical protein
MEIMMELMQERMREMQREMKAMDENCKRMAGLIEGCCIMICSKSPLCSFHDVGEKFVTIGIKNLEIRDDSGGHWEGFMPEQIGKLCNLKTVKIGGFANMQLKHLSKIAHPNVTSFTFLRTHFTDLSFIQTRHPCIVDSFIQTREYTQPREFTIENMPHFPALKSLELSECRLSGFDPSKLLEKYPELKNLSITSCIGINQTEITTFCASHKITLVFDIQRSDWMSQETEMIRAGY